MFSQAMIQECRTNGYIVDTLVAIFRLSLTHFEDIDIKKSSDDTSS